MTREQETDTATPEPNEPRMSNESRGQQTPRISYRDAIRTLWAHALHSDACATVMPQRIDWGDLDDPPTPACTCGLDSASRYLAPTPEYLGPGPQHDPLTIWRWCYRAVLALAKEQLKRANEASGGDWPAGQQWGELGSSSHGVFLEQARDLAGIPHNEFLEIVRNPLGAYGDIAAEEYARACGCSSCRAERPDLFAVSAPPSSDPPEGK